MKGIEKLSHFTWEDEVQVPENLDGRQHNENEIQLNEQVKNVEEELKQAAKNGQLDEVKMHLVNWHFHPAILCKAICKAVKHDHLETVEILFSKLVWDYDRYQCIFIEAAKYGRLEIVKSLLPKASIYPLFDQIKDHASVYAAENGHLEVVKYLYESMLWPTFKRNSYNRLTRAAKNGHLEVVRYLLEITYNYGRLVGLLDLQYNMVGDELSAALEVAVENNKADVVRLILENAPGISVEDKKTALQKAREYGFHDVANEMATHLESLHKSKSFTMAFNAYEVFSFDTIKKENEYTEEFSNPDNSCRKRKGNSKW